MEIDKLIDSSIEPIANAVASVIFYSVQLFDLEIKFILFWLVIAAIFLLSIWVLSMCVILRTLLTCCVENSIQVVVIVGKSAAFKH